MRSSLRSRRSRPLRPIQSAHASRVSGCAQVELDGKLRVPDFALARYQQVEKPRCAPRHAAEHQMPARSSRAALQRVLPVLLNDVPGDGAAAPAWAVARDGCGSGFGPSERRNPGSSSRSGPCRHHWSSCHRASSERAASTSGGGRAPGRYDLDDGEPSSGVGGSNSFPNRVCITPRYPPPNAGPEARPSGCRT